MGPFRVSVGEPQSFLLSKARSQLSSGLIVTASVLGTDGRVRSSFWRATDLGNFHN